MFKPGLGPWSLVCSSMPCCEVNVIIASLAARVRDNFPPPRCSGSSSPPPSVSNRLTWWVFSSNVTGPEVVVQPVDWFDGCSHLSKTFQKSSCTTAERSSGAGTIAEIVEKLGENSTGPVLAQIVPRLVQLSRYHRSAAIDFVLFSFIPFDVKGLLQNFYGLQLFSGIQMLKSATIPYMVWELLYRMVGLPPSSITQLSCQACRRRLAKRAIDAYSTTSSVPCADWSWPTVKLSLSNRWTPPSILPWSSSYSYLSSCLMWVANSSPTKMKSFCWNRQIVFRQYAVCCTMSTRLLMLTVLRSKTKKAYFSKIFLAILGLWVD